MLYSLLNFLINPLSMIVPWADWLGTWIYLILFLWIFLETAFIFFSFLPGQSVLFLTSTIAASAGSQLNIFLLFITFVVAATAGAMVKYWTGLNFENRNRLTKKISDSDQMSETQDFFDRHEDNTLLFSRFVPFIGLFVPIIAGTSKMDWKRFNKLSFAGVLIWVGACCLTGYYFGRTPFVQKYFTIIFLILVILPVIIRFIYNSIKKVR